MSELLNVRNGGVQRQLLTSVSALALMGWLQAANAADDPIERPTVWIELGGQLESATSAPDKFSAPFFNLASPATLSPMIDAQKPSQYSVGGEAKIILQPKGSDWVFSAAVRYGRSNTAKHLHHQSPKIDYGKAYFFGIFSSSHFMPTRYKFGDGQTAFGSSHLILDFQAGKEVGLGLFGGDGTSVVSAGVRFAQFTSASAATFHARPFLHVNMVTSPGKYRIARSEPRGTYTASFDARRSTDAVGPTLSWDASRAVVGTGSDMTLNFDWGVNAAILFGRQRARTQHHTSGQYNIADGASGTPVRSYANPPVSHNRGRTVVIPNAGGFVGASLKFPNAKVSLGYRADFFFNAVDAGIDTARSQTLGYYGPFATIRIGLGG